ncbi:MAG: adenosylmethionine--8-amino-7-oxononanoate transaminase [Planctomycetes bacterium]|nr:adenosylmethionine--8-amino-7-oxononanoate transaminase [Planctomycetota bacterium]
MTETGRGSDSTLPEDSRSSEDAARKRTSRLRELDNAHVWHPFTAMEAYREEEAPIIIAAEDFFLIDDTGQRYLDGHSSLWCNIHGHRVPAIDQAITQQLNKVAHSTLLGLSNEPSIELAAELVRRAPAGLNKVFYADCGAAGVEVALKLAFQYHRQKRGGPQERNLFACLGKAYHGDTVGTISLGGIDRFHSLFGSLMFPALRIPTPAAWGPEQSDALEQQLRDHADQLAGFVIEPLVQAAAGIVVHPVGYLKAVRELTRKYGILMIADEIAVGFGRTGRMFACEHEQVSPDILILSKGLTGGYLPLAATLVTDEIYEAFLGEPWAGRTFQHGHTYTGNPLACAAALASLQLFDDNDLLANVRCLEATIRDELAILTEPATRSDIRAIQSHVAEIRQRGVMVGIDLVLDRQSGAPFPATWRVGHRITVNCRNHGVILRNIGDTVVLMPAPAMPKELVTTLCRTVIQAMTQVLPDLQIPDRPAN